MKKGCWALLQMCALTLIWVIGCKPSSDDTFSEPQPSRPYVAPLPDAHVYGVFVSVRRYAQGQPVHPRPVPPEAELLANRFQERIVQPGQGEILVLQDEAATRGRILDAIGRMAKRVQPTDTFVLFMSTHGREQALQAYDGEVFAHSIDHELDRIHARAILVVIHACQSGSFSSIVNRPNRIGLFSSPADSYSYDAAGHGGYLFMAFNEAVWGMRYSSHVRDTGAYYSDELIEQIHNRYPWVQVVFCTRTWLDTPVALWNSEAVAPAAPVAPTPPPSVPPRQQRRFRHHTHRH